MFQPKVIYSLDELVKLQESSHDYNFSGYDLSSIDFSSAYGQEVLSQLQYSTTTIFPAELQELMMDKLEKAKNPGLNVQAMHKAGYRGKGIKIAIIDQNTDPSHPALEGHIQNVELSSFSEPSYHGPAVDSIAISVAPGAEIIHLSTGGRHDDNLANQALKYIVDYNNNPENEKIRFVSCSWGNELSLSDDRKKLFQELEQQDVMILGGYWRAGERRTAGLYRDLTKSTNDPKSYYSNDRNATKPGIPIGDCTFASKNGGYTFDHIGGASWTYPYLAAIGACALQANPDFVNQKGWQDKLWQLMLETGVPMSNEPNSNRIIQPTKLCKHMHEMYLQAHPTIQSTIQGKGKDSR